MVLPAQGKAFCVCPGFEETVKFVFSQGIGAPTILRPAITATFARRGTALPTSIPVGLSDEFAGDGAKQIQWRAFTARNQLAAQELRVIVQHLRQFLESALAHETQGPK